MLPLYFIQFFTLAHCIGRPNVSLETVAPKNNNFFSLETSMRACVGIVSEKFKKF